MHGFTRFVLGAPCLLAIACGSDEQESSPPEDDGAAEVVPPAWIDAPEEPVSIGQGQTVALTMTLTGTAGVTASVSAAPAELETEISGEPPELTLHASYAAIGEIPFQVDVEDADGLRVGVPVTAAVRALAWQAPVEWTEPSGPEAREHAALVVDAESSRVFLVGGTGYSPYGEVLDDVWRFDAGSAAWAQVTPTGDIPAGGGSRRVAASPDPKVFYLFGGYGGNASNADLYRARIEGDTLAFETVPQQGAPPKRGLHAFAYDATADRYVVFGGVGTKPLADLWTMKIEGDTAIWTEVTPAFSPSPRYGFFYGVDAERGRMIVFSGAQGLMPLDPARDTWALDLRADPPGWELLLEGEAQGVPPGRRNGCMVFDPTGPRLWVFGGTPDGKVSEQGVFAFDARPGKSAWTRVQLEGEPAVRSSGIGFHDAAAGRVFMGFGNTMSSEFRDWAVLGTP